MAIMGLTEENAVKIREDCASSVKDAAAKRMEEARAEGERRLQEAEAAAEAEVEAMRKEAGAKVEEAADAVIKSLIG